ncbi:hypothetical protein [Nostoc parmelioides]|nr:hypothetical protein [Nostoc parmelioides]
MNNSSKSSTEVLAVSPASQRYTMQKLPFRENINKLWKLYRSILSKCMYTSLELAVHSPMVSQTLSPGYAHPTSQVRRSPVRMWVFGFIADFHAYNLVKVGSSDNNQE